MGRARMWSVLLLTAAINVTAFGAPQVADQGIDLLNRFDRGDMTGALASLDTIKVRDPIVRNYIKTATFWIQAVPPGLAWHRTLVASVVALEMGRRLPAPPPFLWPGAPIVVWAVGALAGHPEPTPTERWASLAAIAELEAHSGWPVLVDAGARASVEVPGDVFGPLAAEQGATGLMSKIWTRFPDDPALTLAALEAREYATAFAAAPVAESTSLLAKDALRPADLTALETMAKTPVVARPKLAADVAATRDRTAAQDALARARQVPDLIRSLRALDTVASIRGDVELHAGYLLARTQAWDEATVHLAHAADVSADSETRFLSTYFQGWIAHNRGDHPAALEAYRRALAAEPASPAVSWALAAELLLTADSDARTEARTVLEAMGASKDSRDPLVTYYTGEAWRLPTYLDAMLASLPAR